MKRIIIVIIGILSFVFADAKKTKPFDARTNREVEFFLLEKKEADTQDPWIVSVIPAGVHVKVLRRSYNMLEVALDDGSRGWISPEALCDSAWVKVVSVDLNSLESESRKNYLKNNPRHLNSNTYWYKLGDRCWSRYSTRESDDKRVIALYDKDRKTSYKAYGNTGELSLTVYGRLSHEILWNCLPRAYRYLPETDTKFPQGPACRSFPVIRILSTRISFVRQKRSVDCLSFMMPKEL